MKKTMMMLALVGMALSSQAFAAVGPNSSWDEIYRAGLWPQFRKIVFGNTHIPSINVCVEGDNFVAESPFKKCKAVHETGEEVGTCKEYESGIVTTPRTFTYKLCKEETGDSHCREYTTGTAAYPLTETVDVVESFGGESGERVVFRKSFTIPACN